MQPVVKLLSVDEFLVVRAGDGCAKLRGFQQPQELEGLGVAAERCRMWGRVRGAGRIRSGLAGCRRHGSRGLSHIQRERRPVETIGAHKGDHERLLARAGGGPRHPLGHFEVPCGWAPHPPRFPTPPCAAGLAALT